MVSAVSPLWLMATTSVSGLGTLSRQRYSLATSTVQGMPAIDSSQTLAVMPAQLLVPQARIST